MEEIKLDYNFCVAKNCKKGITAEELEESLSVVRGGYSKLLSMVERKEVGFTELVNKDLSQILNFVKSQNGKYNDMIIAGIGGSSLGFEAIANALLPENYNMCTFVERGYLPRFWVADNVDPAKMHSILKECNPEDTILIVITKSGSTVETISNFSIIYKWFKDKQVDEKEHIVVVTDEKKGSLRKYADENNLTSFAIEENVGGRFSVLSAVGLLPACMLGVDIKKLLEGAKAALKNEKQFLMLASLYYHFYQSRKINVLMPYSSGMQKFGQWYCQLWGESLGKRFDVNNNEIFAGSTPIVSIGAIDQHSQLQLYREGPDDKLITFIQINDHRFDIEIEKPFYKDFEYLNGVKLSTLLNKELFATELALLKSDRPNLKIIIDVINEYTLGYLFMMFELVTAVLGLSLNINPFDQPGVEEGKNFAYGLLGRKGFEEKLKEFKESYKKFDGYIV